jgi:hypothetical protein
VQVLREERLPVTVALEAHGRQHSEQAVRVAERRRTTAAMAADSLTPPERAGMQRQPEHLEMGETSP